MDRKIEIETAAAENVADWSRAGLDRASIVRMARAEFLREIADAVSVRAEIERFAEWGDTGIDPDRADGPDGPDPIDPRYRID